jgi:hypothetical protein
MLLESAQRSNFSVVPKYEITAQTIRILLKYVYFYGR